VKELQALPSLGAAAPSGADPRHGARAARAGGGAYTCPFRRAEHAGAISHSGILCTDECSRYQCRRPRSAIRAEPTRLPFSSARLDRCPNQIVSLRGQCVQMLVSTRSSPFCGSACGSSIHSLAWRVLTEGGAAPRRSVHIAFPEFVPRKAQLRRGSSLGSAIGSRRFWNRSRQMPVPLPEIFGARELCLETRLPHAKEHRPWR
jgi:hypothetical protein